MTLQKVKQCDIINFRWVFFVHPCEYDHELMMTSTYAQ